ncbi:MAG: DUF177 domain-containing protein [Bacilli bacterium]|nr:DUF177 domain-containing protein [Bacilli bacterium]
MNIDLSKLLYNQTDEIIIDEVIDIPKEYLTDDIKDISKVTVTGNVTSDGYMLSLNLNIKCTLTLICSISLKDVKYDINCDVEEEISEDNDENMKILNNSIDLLPIIWQNILMEIPIKVVSPDIEEKNIYGDGWKFITDEEEDKEIDPRLSKLKDYLDE